MGQDFLERERETKTDQRIFSPERDRERESVCVREREREREMLLVMQILSKLTSPAGTTFATLSNCTKLIENPKKIMNKTRTKYQ